MCFLSCVYCAKLRTGWRCHTSRRRIVISDHISVWRHSKRTHHVDSHTNSNQFVYVLFCFFLLFSIIIKNKRVAKTIEEGNISNEQMNNFNELANKLRNFFRCLVLFMNILVGGQFFGFLDGEQFHFVVFFNRLIWPNHFNFLSNINEPTSSFTLVNNFKKLQK